jgi:hypothetical protein
MDTIMKIKGVEHKVILTVNDGKYFIVYERLKDCEPSGYDDHRDKE